MRKFYWVLLCTACTMSEQSNRIDIQGHRGARGLLPENSLPGFLKAVSLGVNTLELDLSVTRDQEVVVSHEPYFSPEYCADKTGKRVREDSLINMYELTYLEVTAYDCGALAHPRFPDQELISVIKPRLVEVFQTVEKYVEEGSMTPVRYNIELKTSAETDNIYHPTPAVFSELVYEVITEAGLWDRVNIQSFDFRTLQYFKKIYPEVDLALLIENQLPWKDNIDSLSFTPEIYSCNYQLLSRDIVEELQEGGMKVIPWTVNDPDEMKKLLDWGVDGIITDYPDRAVELTKK